MTGTFREYFRYLPEAHRDDRWGLRVSAAGSLANAPHRHDLSPHPHPYAYRWDVGRRLDTFQLHYITAGSLVLETECDGETHVAAGTCVVICPGTWHRYAAVSGGTVSYEWVDFSGDYAAGLVAGGVVSPRRPVLECGLSEEIAVPFRCLIERLRPASPPPPQLLASWAIEIIAAATAAAEARAGRAASAGEAAAVDQAAEFLRSQLGRPIDVRQLAASVGLGYDRFRTAFKRRIGLSPRAHLLQLRMERARELLSDTQLPVAQVAAAVGIDNAFHFSAIFKRKCGLSPLAWRRQARG